MHLLIIYPQLRDVCFHRRSHAFRELLLNDMQQYMELTMGINEDNPLPLPSHAAKNMKKKALHALHEWNQKYGSAYKKLSLAYKYLKNCFQVIYYLCVDIY